MQRITIFLLASCFVLRTSAASADPLSDFKDAVGQVGCASIPYSDLRGSCRTEQSNLHDYCDGARGPITCDSESITRQLKDALDKERKSVESLKDKKRSLEDQKSRANDDTEKSRLSREIDQVDRDIYDAGKRVDQAIAELETRKKLVDSAIYTIEKCIDYRRAVMNFYAYALDKVRGESDDDLKPLARQLRDKYEESKRGHEIAIDNKKNALDTCKNSRP